MRTAVPLFFVRFLSFMCFLSLLASSQVQAQKPGRLQGTLSGPNDAPLSGVTVVMEGGGTPQVTDSEGVFVFDRVPVGDHELSLYLGKHSTRLSVQVAADQTTKIEQTVDWDLSYGDLITVVSASRRRERVVDAPAAVTSISREEIQLEGAANQIPNLLSFSAGVDAPQSGVYDFNVNTRGFNYFLSRRVQTLVDGRETISPLTGSQEWYTIGFLLEDLATMEMVRGPSGALYGPNTFNGVLNIVTRPAHLSQGGKVRLTAGELSTLSADLRWARGLGNDWYFKLIGQHAESDNFAVSRNETVEYPGLPMEAGPLARFDIEYDSGMLRFDKVFDSGPLLTLEVGNADGGGEILMSAATRFQITLLKRQWARLNYSTPNWNALAYWNRRDGDDAASLGAGTVLFNDDETTRFELQGNRDFHQGKLRLVGGLSYGEDDLTSFDPDGNQSAYPPSSTDKQAIFAQAEYEATDRLKLVLAARWDSNSLHEDQFSPKGSLVYGLSSNHTLRFSYNEAFQAANGIELFIDILAGPPLDLTALEAELEPFLGGVPLNLEAVPVLALGNPDLDVEKIRSLEFGYRGILGSKVFLTVDYYKNNQKDFISDLLTGANPNLPPYQAPAGLAPDDAAHVEATLNGAFFGLTNDPLTGAAQWVFSHGNFAEVDSQGLEVAVGYQLSSDWHLDFNYTWFDFDVQEEAENGITINPNTPEHKFATSLTYAGDRLRAALRFRWIDTFDWAAGVFIGPVPSYEAVNLSASFDLTDRWNIGLNVSNLLDDEHYEVFGGDLLRRRALAHASFSW